MNEILTILLNWLLGLIGKGPKLEIEICAFGLLANYTYGDTDMNGKPLDEAVLNLLKTHFFINFTIANSSKKNNSIKTILYNSNLKNDWKISRDPEYILKSYSNLNRNYLFKIINSGIIGVNENEIFRTGIPIEQGQIIVISDVFCIEVKQIGDVLISEKHILSNSVDLIVIDAYNRQYKLKIDTAKGYFSNMMK